MGLEPGVRARYDPCMPEVVTLVTGVVSEERLDDLAEEYRAGVAAGLPPAIQETFLVEADGGRVGILTIWRRRSELEAMLATGEEPFARRLIRTAGGTPEVTLYRVREHAGEP